MFANKNVFRTTAIFFSFIVFLNVTLAVNVNNRSFLASDNNYSFAQITQANPAIRKWFQIKDASGNCVKGGTTISFVACSLSDSEQIWYHSRDFKLRNGNGNFLVANGSSPGWATSTQEKWDFIGVTYYRLKNLNSNSCIEKSSNTLNLASCNLSSPNQEFTLNFVHAQNYSNVFYSTIVIGTKCLTSGGKLQKLTFSNCTGTNNQIFKLLSNDDGFSFSIISEDYYVGVHLNYYTDNAKLSLFYKIGVQGQSWVLSVGTSEMYLRAKHSAKCLSIDSNNNAIQTTCSSSTKVDFPTMKFPSELTQIVAKTSGQCLRFQSIGQNLKIDPCADHIFQAWRFVKAGSADNIFFLESPLDISRVENSNGNSNDDNPIVIGSRADADKQKWAAVALGNGYFKLVNQGTGKCLDSPWTDNTKPPHLWTCNETTNQIFSLRNLSLRKIDESRVYNIRMKQSGLCMRAQYPAEVIQKSDCSGTQGTLKWTIKKEGDDYYSINSFGLFIEVPAGNPNIDVNLKTYRKWGTENQFWHIYPTDINNSYVLVNKQTRRCMDSGTLPYQYYCYFGGSDYQKIEFIETTPLLGENILPSTLFTLKAKSSNKCIEIAGLNTELIQKNCDLTKLGQLFRLEANELNNEYYIKSSTGVQVIENYNDGQDIRNPIKSWQFVADKNQIWLIIPNNSANNEFLIANISSNKCIDNKGDLTENTNYHQWNCAFDNNNQIFTFTASSSTYRLPQAYNLITNIKSGKCMRFDTENGPIKQGDCDVNNSKLLWYLEEMNDHILINSVDDYSFDLSGSSTSNGSKITSYKFHGDDNQRWYIFPVSNNQFQIKTVISGAKCVDLSAGNTSDNADYQIWDCDTTNPNQLFTFAQVNLKEITRKRVLLKNKSTGMCLIPSGHNARIIESNCLETNLNQHWIIKHNYFGNKIVSPAGELFFDNDAYRSNDGNPINAYDEQTTDNQVWYVRHVDEEHFQFAESQYKKCAQVENGQLSLYTCDNTKFTQHFKIIPINDGLPAWSFSLKSKSSNKCLYVSGFKEAIKQGACDGDDSSRFHLWGAHMNIYYIVGQYQTAFDNSASGNADNNLQLAWQFSGDDNQQYRIFYSLEGERKYLRFQSAQSGKCLYMSDNNDGTTLKQITCDATANNQKFEVNGEEM